MKKIVLLLALMASPAMAKPVYLDCAMRHQDGMVDHRQITFDEEADTFTWSSGDKSGKMKAIITADTVSGVDVGFNTETWTINRHTGQASDLISVDPSFPPVGSTGTCTPVQVQQKF